MTRIERAFLECVHLEPPVRREDAIQSFVRQETPLLRLICSDGSEGVGYTYTIGTGGSSIMALLIDHLLPRLIGQDPDRIEAIWCDLLFHTHATHVGAVTSLALAAIDTALWDRRAKRRLDGNPLVHSTFTTRRHAHEALRHGDWHQV
jgi:L-alanine-DL-glutamate epimerase-like enolase superfamily enzyme